VSVHAIVRTLNHRSFSLNSCNFLLKNSVMAFEDACVEAGGGRDQFVSTPLGHISNAR
jgi:hypothetical protein